MPKDEDSIVKRGAVRSEIQVLPELKRGERRRDLTLSCNKPCHTNMMMEALNSISSIGGTKYCPYTELKF